MTPVLLALLGVQVLAVAAAARAIPAPGRASGGAVLMTAAAAVLSALTGGLWLEFSLGIG